MGIVESPAKARTVGQILGGKYVVTASQGHVRDLPKSKIGVDVDQDFEPSYVIMKDKQSLLTQIKKAGNEAKEVFLATDPDREGEAISWHLQNAANWGDLKVAPKRVVFHKIYKRKLWRKPSKRLAKLICNLGLKPNRRVGSWIV
ncbi:MAG: hypothetical protein CM1200mP22_32050 [Dehalococcoidia bacterium]|nr:MAG: hypothetical protein CM1200mP22_32050 [Dehalococcoidia bacterium]